MATILLTDKHCVRGVHDIAFVTLDTATSYEKMRNCLCVEFDRDTQISGGKILKETSGFVYFWKCLTGRLCLSSNTKLHFNEKLSWWLWKLPGLFGLDTTENVLHLQYCNPAVHVCTQPWGNLAQMWVETIRRFMEWNISKPIQCPGTAMTKGDSVTQSLSLRYVL